MANGDGFEVQPQAIMDYANALVAQAQAMQTINGVVSGLHVSGDAFGKLPGSGDLHTQYESHAQEETDNTAQMSQFLEGIAEALGAVAQLYAETEGQHVSALNAIAAGRTGGN